MYFILVGPLEFHVVFVIPTHNEKQNVSVFVHKSSNVRRRKSQYDGDYLGSYLFCGIPADTVGGREVGDPPPHTGP